MNVAGDEKKEAAELLSVDVDVPPELTEAIDDDAAFDDEKAVPTLAVDGSDEPVPGDTATADEDAEIELAAADAAVLEELLATAKGAPNDSTKLRIDMLARLGCESST